MTARVQINWPVVEALLQVEPLRQEIERHTRRVDDATNSESRVDISNTGERPRGAVIAGYEHGATAESTRRALLAALDGE